MTVQLKYDRWGERITRLRIPLPFPLKWVNCYMVEGLQGYTVIDTGIHNELAEQHWRAFMKQQGLQFSDIEKIVLTHHHPDHYGLSGWLQQHSNAPVYISQSGAEQTELLWGDHSSLSLDLIKLFRQHGMEQDKLEEMSSHMEEFLQMVTPRPKLNILQAGGSFMIGDQSYQMIDTPGHAKGHISFYRAQTAEIFCGDHVIARLTPNVSYLPGIDENPLKSYLESLQSIKKLKVNQAFSGHWHPFENYNLRAAEIIDHHAQRLKWIKQQLIQPISAYQLCLRMFRSELSIHQMRFAMAETLAHLVYLQQQGEAATVNTNGELLWTHSTSSCLL